MELSVDRQTEITVVKVAESVDSADSDALRSFLSDLIDGGQTRLVVDLSDMDFIVSMGLGVFVQHLDKLPNFMEPAKTGISSRCHRDNMRFCHVVLQPDREQGVLWE